MRLCKFLILGEESKLASPSPRVCLVLHCLEDGPNEKERELEINFTSHIHTPQCVTQLVADTTKFHHHNTTHTLLSEWISPLTPNCCCIASGLMGATGNTERELEIALHSFISHKQSATNSCWHCKLPYFCQIIIMIKLHYTWRFHSLYTTHHYGCDLKISPLCLTLCLCWHLRYMTTDHIAPHQ